MSLQASMCGEGQTSIPGRDHGVWASVSKLEVTLGNSGWDGTVGWVPTVLVIQVAFLSTVFLEDDGSVACGRDEKQG